MNKDARLNLRLPADLHAEIVAAAEAGEYRYVSTWVEEACREKIERDQEGQHPQIPPTIQRVDTGPVQVVREPFQCPRFMHHRIGAYCSGCKKVITKRG